jgi:hypothetical protein
VPSERAPVRAAKGGSGKQLHAAAVRVAERSLLEERSDVLVVLQGAATPVPRLEAPGAVGIARLSGGEAPTVCRRRDNLSPDAGPSEGDAAASFRWTRRPGCGTISRAVQRPTAAWPGGS